MHVVKILRDKLTLNSDSVFFSSCKCLLIEDFSIFPSFQIFVITGNYVPCLSEHSGSSRELDQSPRGIHNHHGC